MGFKFSAFSLMELLVTVTIIAALGMIAAPAYSKYRVRSKTAYMATSALAAKLVVANDYVTQGYTFANSNYAAGTEPFVTSASPVISSIAISLGVITVTGNSAELGNRAINLVFTPSAVDQNVVWTCQTDSQFLDFVPTECKNAI